MRTELDSKFLRLLVIERSKCRLMAEQQRAVFLPFAIETFNSIHSIRSFTRLDSVSIHSRTSAGEAPPLLLCNSGRVLEEIIVATMKLVARKAAR